MMRLLRVEVRRLLARRAVLLLLLGAVAMPAVVGAVVAWEHRPVSASELAEAKQRVAEDRDRPWVRKEIQRCERKPGRFGVRAEDPDATAAACRERIEPTLDRYLWRTDLSLADELSLGSSMVVTVVLLALLTLAGTTFAGHDWNSGSVTNQLLFEPRRSRIWTAKALAVALVSAVVAVTVQTAYWVGLWLVARAFGHEQRDGVLRDALELGGRAALLITVGAVGAYGLTMLFRSTVGVLGVMAVVAAAGGLIIGALGIDPQWTPGHNLAAFVQDGLTFEAEGRCGPRNEPCWEERTLTFTHAATYFGVALAAAVAVSFASFRVRDV